ncbi:MAG: M23 family metallopeptidase [Longimicrobiales bacterium]|nr:M23 family metallopeptidase [Longimicrobiales bacterium]
MTRRLLVRAVVALTLVVSSGCALPRWPVDAPISSSFGVRWRGVLPEVHRGVDLAVPEGTPVRAMAGGRVAFAGVQGGFGNAVWIDHGGEVWSLYAHLSRLDVATGREVGPGQAIGLSGSTGDVTGPHLHFEVWRWGRAVDPVPLLGRPSGEE